MSKWVIALSLVSHLAGAVERQPELNIAGFTDCLKKQAPTFSLNDVQDIYHFNRLDFLLPYLAFYSGQRFPLIDVLIQDRALQAWQENFEEQAAILAEKLDERIGSSVNLTPAEFFGMALQVCPTGDVFCAALTAHNVLRTLGRYRQGDENYNPTWFEKDRLYWQNRNQIIEQGLFSLRKDGLGDRWGEWYHFFGLLTYSIRSMSIRQKMSSVEFIAELNQLAALAFTGKPESEEKSEIDRDSVEVSWQFLTGHMDYFELNTDSSSCADRSAYVLSNPLKVF